MPYILIVIFALGAGAGGFGVHYFDGIKIAGLEKSIAVANAKAADDLAQAQKKIIVAQNMAAEFNAKLEKEHDEKTKQINTINGRLVNAIRMYKNSRKNCGVTVSDDTGSRVVDEQAGGTDFSTRLAELARRADLTAQYAQTCYSFVNNNCGIPKQTREARKR